MVAQLQQPYRLKVRVGNNEFEADGPEETVKSQFDMFLMALQHSPQATNGNTPQAKRETPLVDPKVEFTTIGNGSIEQNTWERFYKLEGEGDVSLKILPSSKNQK